MAEGDYLPEKWIWTSADFERMGWHDVYIHAIGFQNLALAFDIDYTWQRIKPAAGEIYYKSWMSPATLIFDDARDVHITLKPEPDGCPIVMKLHRSDAVAAQGGQPTWLWQFECLQGEITFRAADYRQFIRRRPVLASSQFFSEAERGGITFSQVTPETDAG
ncbi:MAG TPA: hypothetical protein VHB20_12695 [Verrucomicrobiae bacterium]|jgi:hypothetical protein|nr:hypothetical protein [Verrucomicrobiae bacterium]